MQIVLAFTGYAIVKFLAQQRICENTPLRMILYVKGVLNKTGLHFQFSVSENAATTCYYGILKPFFLRKRVYMN